MSKTPVGQSKKIGNIEVRNLGMGLTCPPLIGLGDCKVYVGCHTATIDAFSDVAWLAEQDGVVVPESLDVVEEAVSPDELDCGLSYWVALINSEATKLTLDTETALAIVLGCSGSTVKQPS